MTGRDPETCELRVIRDQRVSCGLIARLLRGLSEDCSVVSPEICGACCRSFRPSEYDLNPVVAAVLWSQCDRALTEPGVTLSADLEDQLVELRSFAEASLPLVLADEDDLPVRPEHGASLIKADSVEELAERLPSLFREGRRLKSWAVGITTAPRREATLNQCLHSVSDCGWSDFHLFIDGEVQVPAEFQTGPRTVRTPPAGAWRNYYLGLTELLRRTPDAEALLMLQDDALWPSHLPMREYLSSLVWPDHGRFLVSPYCCADYTADAPGWHCFTEVWRYGAVAMIFSRQAAEEFLADPVVIARCRSERQAGIDDVIGEWTQRTGIDIYFSTPSLVQHIGDVSTLWPTSRAVGLRRASRFLGDEVRTTSPMNPAPRSILCGWLSVDPPVVYHSMDSVDPGHYLPDEPITRFIMSLWHHTAEEIAATDRRIRELRPKHTVHHCVNDPHITRELTDMGISAHFINQNAFLDEQLFRIQPEQEKIYDAVYNARMVPFKRHALASDVPRLLVIGGTYSQDDSVEYYHTVRAALPQAEFTLETSGRYILPADVSTLLNRSRAGLCLSATEGAMYAATEYLLCGLPVVSTDSVGGRDVWFDPRFTRLVPDDPRAIADAVQELISLRIPPQMIRAATLQRMWEHRQRFIELGQAAYKANHTGREFARDFYTRFRNKIGDWCLPGDIYRIRHRDFPS